VIQGPARRPVALMLLGILHLIQDAEAPHEVVARLMGALPAGSYLALSHPARDIHPGQDEAQQRYNERVSTPQTLRTRAQVSRFFAGLDLVPPGLVYVHAWRPAPGGHRSRRWRVGVRRRCPQALIRPGGGYRPGSAAAMSSRMRDGGRCCS